MPGLGKGLHNGAGFIHRYRVEARKEKQPWLPMQIKVLICKRDYVLSILHIIDLIMNYPVEGQH